MSTKSHSVLDSISAHVAILDEKGRILETNQAWKDFEKTNSNGKVNDSTGLNYLNVCEAAKGPEAIKAQQVAQGIRSVVKGEIKEFEMQYSCHWQDKKRWFNMRVTRLKAQGPLRLVVSHENITKIKRAQEILSQSQDQLTQKTYQLEEANAALRFLLKQRDQDQKELEQKVLAQTQNLIVPFLEKLKLTCHEQNQKFLVDIILTNLKEIVSPFAQTLASHIPQLTPMEIKIADLIKQGKTTKEIAETLHLSSRTIDFHRGNLRTKFGLSKSRANLRSHLMTLA